MNKGIIEVEADRISIPEWSIREEATDKQIEVLTRSIKFMGLACPIIVREHEDGYQVVAGRRRLEICKLVGREIVSAIIIDDDEFEANGIRFQENSRDVCYTGQEIEIIIKYLMSMQYCDEDIATLAGISIEEIVEILRYTHMSEILYDDEYFIKEEYPLHYEMADKLRQETGLDVEVKPFDQYIGAGVYVKDFGILFWTTDNDYFEDVKDMRWYLFLGKYKPPGECDYLSGSKCLGEYGLDKLLVMIEEFKNKQLVAT